MAKTDIALETERLTKRYGSFTVLDSLNLTVKKGEVLGYLGPNGAGKTTTIRSILGLIRPTGGHARIFGLDAWEHKVAVHKQIAYVPGETMLWPSLTGEETLHLLAAVHGELDTQYQKALIERFQFDPHKRVRTYSKGNRQKINLIAAFASRADLLVMDEPTSGLDPLMEQAFRQCVLGEVEALCDRLAILRAGKLIELGTLEQLRHLSAITVEATFEGMPPDVSHIMGIHNARVTGHRLSVQIQGPIDKLLTVIANAHPQTLLSREPSLEELFLSIYGDDKDVRNPEVRQ
jgi:ABC-2 type transport system ATP-binding protein